MHHLFISYSRHDRAFVERLSRALVDHGQDTWVDWQDIPPTAAFMDEIRRAIEAADSFVFVISPESCKSVVCRQELAYAAKNNKRLIPVVCTKTPDPDVPPELAPLNWIIFDGAAFDGAIATLTSAIAADLVWVRAHTELLVRATEWDQAKRSRSGLLRGDELATAEHRLIEAASGKQPPPTQLQQEFVAASRQNATRTLRQIVGGVSTALVVAASLAVLAFYLFRLADTRRQQADEQRGIADEQRGIAVKNGDEAKAQATRAENEAQRANASAAEAIAQRDRAESEKNRAEDAARIIAANDLADTDPTSAALLLLELHDPATQELSALAALHHVAEQPISMAVLRGHTGHVMSAAFSPDGRRVVTAGDDGTARIWPADGRGEPVVLRGHESNVTFARFSPDGRKVVTASGDKTARVWSTNGGPALAVLRGHAAAVRFATFTDDNAQVLTWALDNTVRAWSAQGGEGHILIAVPAGAIRDVSVAGGVLRVVAVPTGDDKTARVYAIGGGGPPVTLRGHDGKVRSAVFSRDGAWLVTTADDRTARVWRADGQGDPIVLRDAQDAYGAEFSPDGSRIVTTGTENVVRVWNANGQGAPVVLRGHAGPVGTAHFSPDGEHIVSTSDDRTARVWPIDGRTPPVVLRGHDGPVYSATFSPDGARIVTTGSDGVERVWLTEGSLEPFVARGHTDRISEAAFDRTGARIVTASRDTTVRVWPLDRGTPPVVLKGHTSDVAAATFSPDGTRILTRTQDGLVWIWHADGTGTPIVLEGHTGRILHVAFSADGRRAIGASDGNVLYTWNAGTGQKISDLQAADAWVAISPDGSRAVTLSTSGLPRLWTLDDRHAVVDLQEPADKVFGRVLLDTASSTGGRLTIAGNGLIIWPTNGNSAPLTARSQPTGILSIAFSPDGKRLIVGCNDRTARILAADGSNAPDIILRGHTDTVLDVAFSPDGRWVVTSSDDGTARIWNADGHGDPVVFRAAQTIVQHVAFGANGSRILTRTLTQGPDGVRVWRVQPADLLAFLRGSTTACLAPDVRIRALGEDEHTANATFDGCERAKK